MKNFIKKRNKYNSHSCKCLSGHIHMSRGEAGYCNSLYYLKKSKEILDYEIQKKFSMDINGVHITNHYADFWVTLNDGTQQVEEFKGFETDIWKMKRRLFQALYPDVKYIVVRPKRGRV